MNGLNFNHFYYFYIVSKFGGMTAASRFLNTSQSSLSIQIKNLESTLKKKLFQKVGRNVVLTDEGKEVYQYCRRSFELFEEMMDQLEHRPSAMGVRINIGVADEIERPFVTEALAKVAKCYPNEKVPLLNLISLPAERLESALEAGEIDLLLTNQVYLKPNIHILKEINLSIGMFFPTTMLKKKEQNSKELISGGAQSRFVLPSRLTSLRGEIDMFLGKKKMNIVAVFESNIMAAVVRAAADGLGGVIMPEAYVEREIVSGRLVKISDKPLWYHRLLLLTIKDKMGKNKLDFADKLSTQLTMGRK